MSLQISEETEAKVVENARGLNLSVDEYLQDLMHDDEIDFVRAVEKGIQEVEEGHIKPAREALTALGQKLGLSR